MSDPEPPVIDYRVRGTPLPRRRRPRGRPRRLVSHARTAALLCVLTIAIDVWVSKVRGSVRQIPLLELLLPAYGAAIAASAALRGRLRPSDRRWLWCCTAVYVLTLAWAGAAPRFP